MKAYDDLFAIPIQLDILRAIAAIIGLELPADPNAPATALVPAACWGPSGGLAAHDVCLVDLVFDDRQPKDCYL
jgi:hypothetical protein